MAIVTLTTALPHAAIEHAGGKYLDLLFKALGPERVTVVAPPLPSVVRAMGLPGHPPNTIVTDGVPPRLARLEGYARRIDLGQPALALRRAIIHDGRVRDALSSADVIDLQWQDSIRLGPMVKKLAPHARIVGTFHDVQSQKFERLVRSSTGRRRAKWEIARRIAVRAEARAMQVLDQAIVFSAKDADLLPPGAPVTVIDPPLAPDVLPTHAVNAEQRVVFVSFLIRPENHEAALWMLSEVWPVVLREFPHASLRLVGAGATPELQNVVTRTPRVQIAGFVEDLAAEMAAARLAVVPLHEGAGVKFKTIEALLAGVPVVTTSVGAEGIEPRDLFWSVADDAAGFARAVTSALADPAAAQRVADAAQREAGERYGFEGFRLAVRRLYTETQ